MGRTKGSKNKPKDPNAPKKPRKARAAKAPEVPKTETRPTSSPASASGQGFKKPTADQVQRLVKSIVSMSNESRLVSQAVGEKIAKAVETQHFDKKALGYVKSMYSMSINRPEAWAITLPHLLSYIDDLGIAEIADGARGLAINGEDDDGGDPDDGDQVDLEDAIAEKSVETIAANLKADSWDNSSPRLSIVPGPNAPTADVPSAPEAESDAA